MNTTLYVADPEIWQAAKRYAKVRGVSLSTLVAVALRAYLRAYLDRVDTQHD